MLLQQPPILTITPLLILSNMNIFIRLIILCLLCQDSRAVDKDLLTVTVTEEQRHIFPFGRAIRKVSHFVTNLCSPELVPLQLSWFVVCGFYTSLFLPSFSFVPPSLPSTMTPAIRATLLAVRTHHTELPPDQQSVFCSVLVLRLFILTSLLPTLLIYPQCVCACVCV